MTNSPRSGGLTLHQTTLFFKIHLYDHVLEAASIGSPNGGKQKTSGELRTWLYMPKPQPKLAPGKRSMLVPGTWVSGGTAGAWLSPRLQWFQYVLVPSSPLNCFFLYAIGKMVAGTPNPMAF